MAQNPTASFILESSSSTSAATPAPVQAAASTTGTAGGTAKKTVKKATQTAVKKPAKKSATKKTATQKVNRSAKNDSPAYDDMSRRKAAKKSAEIPKLNEDTLVLVDISSFIFRAFFAIPVLHNPKGEPTNAVYGVANMMMKLVDDAKPARLVAVFDSKSPSFRHEMYEEYKANRSEPPEDLRPQFARVEELADRLKLPKLRVDGFEADDLIATLTVEWAKNPDRSVVIVTGDKDLMQLVGDRVRVWDTMKGKVFGPDEVKEKFGVGPGQIRDYLAMVGDSSDNVPGIPGIGPKTATVLLAEYPELSDVVAAAKAGKIKGKRAQVIAETEEQAILSQKLVTLREDVPLGEWNETSANYRFEIDRECVEFFREMGFRMLVQKYENQSGTSSAAGVGASGVPGGEKSISEQMDQERFEMVGASLEFQSITDRPSLDRLIDQIARRGEFCVDLETTSLNPRAAELVGVALSANAKHGHYVPVGHRGVNSAQLPAQEVLAALKPVLEDPKIKLIGQNLKYDLSVFHQQGVRPVGLGADTMIASYVLDPSSPHGFDSLCERYLNYRSVPFSAVVGKGKDQLTFDQVPIDQATRYAAEDALYTYRLWEVMRPELQRRQLMEVFARVDLPLVPVLTQMEENGVRIDQGFLKNLSKEFETDLARIEKEIQGYSKAPINLNSPKQLAVLLFDELGLPTQSKTKTGFSTDAKVLEALSGKHPVPKLLLEFREISKLKSTYVDPLPQMVDPKTDRIHAKFNQTVAATGRLSSSDPNLQNIPIRTPRGRRIREAFIASDGCKILSSDYSQIELRILAHMSEDEVLCESFQKGEDVHARTASELFGGSASDVTKEQRGVAKAINFGLMYGKTPFGLAQELNISRGEAKEFIDRYFDRYRGVKRLLNGLVEEARENQETMTLLGRKRSLLEIRSSNPAVRNNAERMAMNTPIQGTAADMMKIAMIDLADSLEEGGFESKFMIQVHDEVVLDCPESEVEAVIKIVESTLEGAMDLKVPLVAESSVGSNWKDA